jgi:hypothetical protein
MQRFVKDGKRRFNKATMPFVSQVVHSRELIVRKVSGSNNVNCLVLAASKVPSGAVYCSNVLNNGISYIEKDVKKALLLPCCLLPCDYYCET